MLQAPLEPAVQSLWEALGAWGSSKLPRWLGSAGGWESLL